jgi:hypothetical protein
MNNRPKNVLLAKKDMIFQADTKGCFQKRDGEGAIYGHQSGDSYILNKYPC